MTKTISRTCINPSCGKVFMARQCDIKRGWAHMCSKACAAVVRERTLDRNGYSKHWNGRSNAEQSGK